MVTSEGLASVEPWLYRQGFNVDSWLLHDTFSHDNDLLAKALHNTVSAPPPHTLPPSSTHTLSSNVSGGSSQEVVGGGAKRKHNGILTEGKTTKRGRSRPSKKPQTTFITADPSNFRQMVQQVTGAKYVDDTSSSVLFTPIVKPEPHRLVNILTGAVPTLDTSAFLTNHHHENLLAGNTFSGSDAVGLPPEKANAKSGGSAAEFDPYPTFPTLESWKVM
ncbi:hypothetical protein BRARA_D02501 [Brassica rapa]|uniref:VQ domain-containing protein n=1 Tax=Brassica campestris TaxID=3711 RepID=A0A397ZP68_BRACM|nr:hypothetical protein BRARA_D02501 [Brassica rapa]